MTNNTIAEAPTITSASSNKANGPYTVGEIIDIVVIFSENVTSTGNVTVTLETGATDRTCTFTVSNSDTGTCNYTVQATDTSEDLTVSSISGIIADQSANAMVDFTITTNLATNKDFLIDTTAPTVSITTPTEGATVSGASVSIVASASDTNTIGGVQFKRATNTAIGAEDTSPIYGVTWDTTGLSNGVQSLIAVVRDTAGNYATSTAISVTVDNTAPTITSVSSSKTNGSYTVGEVIDIDVTFSEAVTSTGNVTVTLETGATDRTCTFTVSNSDTGTCNYTVQSTDTTADLTVNSISGTIADQASNAMVSYTIGTNLAANKALVIDTTAPTVSITAPTEGATVSGASVSITADASDTNLFGVLFKRDTNTAIGAEDTTSTYGVTWDTTLLSNGIQSLIAIARDLAGNYATSTAVSVTIDNTAPAPPDTTPPSISSPLPSGVQAEGTTSVNLSVTTDENATCKYSSTPDTAYNSMEETFVATSTVTYHSRTISVLPDTSYAYYVRCSDEAENVNTSDETISFSIPADATPPDEGDEESVADTPSSSSSRSSTGTRGSSSSSSNNSSSSSFFSMNTVDTILTSLKEKLSSDPSDKQSISDFITKLKEEFAKLFDTTLKTPIPNGDSSSNTGGNNFTIDLELGDSHPDVKLLQQFLNTHGYPVAQSGPGSLGFETEKFGYATEAALKRFQVANNITPAVGYFGVKTRGVVNGL